MGIPEPYVGKWSKPIALGSFGLQEGAKCTFMQLTPNDYVSGLEATFDNKLGVTAVSIRTKNKIVKSFGRKTKNHYTQRFLFND